MKANAPRRKVFNDAIDLLTEDIPVVVENGIQMISVERIQPFHNHPFRMYEGERLADMVDSVKEHGILNPVIVHKTEEGYEMLSGHNRWNAAKLAGLKEIPAIVKDGLAEEEAYVYVIETNLMQRSFTDMLPSEKAAVLAERYDKVMCQGKRNDILKEIAKLEGKVVKESCGHDVHRLKNRDKLGQEYGMTGRNIARYMRLNQLVPALKEKVDDGNLTMVAAVDLSYLSEREQMVVAVQEEEGKIKLTPKNVEVLKQIDGEITAEKIKEAFTKVDKQSGSKDVSIKIPGEMYKRFFKDMKPEEVAGIVEQALEVWFAAEGSSC